MCASTSAMHSTWSASASRWTTRSSPAILLKWSTRSRCGTTKIGPVTVEVREPVGGDWEVVNSNYKWTKLDATTIGFSIPVEKDGAATLDYRVRVKW